MLSFENVGSLQSGIFRRSARNIIYSAIAAIWPLVLGLAITPLMIRRLGTDIYGIWTIVMSVTGMMGFFQFGLGDATVKYFSKYHAQGEIKQACLYVRATLFVYGITGLLAAIAIVLLTPSLTTSVFHIQLGLQQQARIALWIGAISLGITFINSSIAAVPRALQRYDITSSINLVIQTLWYVGIAGFLLAGYGLIALLAATVVQNLARLLALTWISRHLVPTLRIVPEWKPKVLRELLLGYGLWAMVLTVSGVLMANVVQLFIGHYLGTSAVTYYTVPNKVALLVHSLPAAMMVFLFPMASAMQSANQSKQLMKSYNVSVRFAGIASAVLMTPFLILARPILTLWVGEDIASHSTMVLQLQSVHYYLQAQAIVPFFILNGIGKIKVNACFSLAHPLIALPIYIVMIGHFGILGPPMTNTVYSLIAALVYLWVTDHFIGQNVKLSSLLKRLFIPLLPVLAIFGVDHYLLQWGQTTNSILGLLAAGAGYALVVLTMGLLLDKLVGDEPSLFSLGNRLVRGIRRRIRK